MTDKQHSAPAPLHIAVDGTALYGVFGGVEYSLWNLLVALRAAGSPHRFTIWIPRDGPTAAQTNAFGPQWKWRRLPFRGEEKARRIWWQQFQLPRLLRRERCHLLHAPTYVAPLRARIPVVLGVYDVIALTHPEFATRGNQWHYQAVLPRSMARAARIIVPSEKVKTEVEQFVPQTNGRVCVVPLGVESSFFEPVPEATMQAVRERYNLPAEYLLFAGNFEPKKNLPTVLKALDLVPDAPALALVGGGRAWTNHNPEFLLKNVPRSVRSRVRMIGYVRRRDMPVLFAGCRAFIFPSLAEGFCLPVAEALAAGVPVVTSDVVPLPHIEKVALISAPLDADALAHHIRRILYEPSLDTRLREKGPEYAKQFTWSRSARLTLDVYESAMARAPRKAKLP